MLNFMSMEYNKTIYQIKRVNLSGPFFNIGFAST